MATISQIASLGREFNPLKVILFGSYAHGGATTDSDVDILVIMSHQGKSWRTATKIRHQSRPGFAVDLLVRSPEQVRQRCAMGDCFIRDITDNGRILYEAPDR